MPATSQLKVADLTLDTSLARVTRAGTLIRLTTKEYAVLKCLMRASGRVITRTMIADEVWNYTVLERSNVVDVYIRKLRRKIDDNFEVKLIHTIRGAGYRLDVEEGNMVP